MKIYIYIISLFVFPILANQTNSYDEETLLVLKERALNEARLLIMQEIVNATKDIKINNEMREELIENLCSTAPMNNFTVNADISDSLAQNAGDFSGSIFVSRDGQSSWFSSSEVALIGTEGYENTWQTSVETSGNNNVDWYLSGLINSNSFGLDYGNITVSQSPNNTYNNSGTTTYATIVTDDTGDASSDYDVQSVLASYMGSDEGLNQLLFSLDLAGSCCDEGGLFGPWYLYGIGIVNPDSEELNAYAVGYGNGGFGQLTPGLLTIEGDLASGEVAGFEYITEDISYNESGDKLQLAVDGDYLFNHPGFGEWPNSLEGLVLVGVVVEASLDGLDIAVDVLDQTDVGIVLLNSQHQDGNAILTLSDPSFDSENNQLAVTYTDLDNNLPWYRAAQICNTPENGGNCFASYDMIPSAHTYSEGVDFNIQIPAEELIDEHGAGDYEAHFWFADSDDLGTAQIELPITIGDGGGCLLGDSNGDGQLNVLDVVLLVNLVLAPSYEECADTNNDGQLNVLDIVTLVNLVLTP